MPGICCPNPAVNRNWMTHQSPFIPQRANGARCCSAAPGNGNGSKTPQLLKLAVSGVTELLRLFSLNQSRRLNEVSNGEKDEILVSGVDDVLKILKFDYENAYFVTGVFTSAIYADDCIFEDPTTRFRGCQFGNKFCAGKMEIKLVYPICRTYLKLPWRPLISIDGSTFYELDDKFMIVRHTESWNVSALEAVGQIFTPSFGSPND